MGKLLRALISLKAEFEVRFVKRANSDWGAGMKAIISDHISWTLKPSVILEKFKIENRVTRVLH